RIGAAPESLERFKAKVRELWSARQSRTSIQLRDAWRRYVLGWRDGSDGTSANAFGYVGTAPRAARTRCENWACIHACSRLFTPVEALGSWPTPRP
ncbi:MAG: hypothetical protein M3Y57_02050, partial [Acidobacteriota bacterium]|nr:hypothetical protein [Acidobacteriota bacterium]